MATSIVTNPVFTIGFPVPVATQRLMSTVRVIGTTVVTFPTANVSLALMDTARDFATFVVSFPVATMDTVLSIDPVGVDSYFVYDDSGGTYTDYTTEANSATIDDVFDMATDPAGPSDAVYIGLANQFDMVFVNITTQSGTNQLTHGLWEYWDGSSWASLTVTQNSWMSETGTGQALVSFTEPGDWATTTVNSATKYFIRWRWSIASNPSARRRLATVTLRQTQFPAASVGYYPQGVATFAHFTKWTQATVAWATKIQTELDAYQRDYASAAGNFTWLASRLAVLRASDGTWKPDALTHGAFSPTADQHHSQAHATIHNPGGSDAIQSAGGGRGGYMPSHYIVKLDTLAASSTRNYCQRYVKTSAQVTSQGFICVTTYDHDVVVAEQTSRILPTSNPFFRVVGDGNVGIHMQHAVYNSAYASSIWCRHMTLQPVDWYFWYLAPGGDPTFGVPLWPAQWISQQIITYGH